MPNTPAVVLEGATALAGGPGGDDRPNEGGPSDVRGHGTSGWWLMNRSWMRWTGLSGGGGPCVRVPVYRGLGRWRRKNGALPCACPTPGGANRVGCGKDGCRNTGPSRSLERSGGFPRRDDDCRIAPTRKRAIARNGDRRRGSRNPSLSGVTTTGYCLPRILSHVAAGEADRDVKLPSRHATENRLGTGPFKRARREERSQLWQYWGQSGVYRQSGTHGQ